MASNNRLLFGAIGCLFVLAFLGVGCMGVGLGGYLYTRGSLPDVAATTTAPAPAVRPDLLTDASFLDVSTGPFAGPKGAGVEATPPPVLPVEPKLAPHAAAAKPTARPTAKPAEPTPPAAEDDEPPIISDEDAKALDAQVQEIQKENAAPATTDAKKKKKK